MSNFQQKSFQELTTAELFEIYRLRTAVFVVEQTCAYQEVDDLDLTAQHLFTQAPDGKIRSYARLMDERDQVRIGRVVVAPDDRGNGSGRELVAQAIAACKATYPDAGRIIIQAQAYLQKFYESFGFQPISDVYLDIGIPHLDMILPIK